MRQEYLDRYLYPVKLVKNETEISGQNVVESISGRVISNVSNRYTLVQNKDLVQPVVDVLGIEQLSRIREYNGNRSFLFEFLTGRNFDLGGGDIIKEKILIRNSYDKTKSFSFMAGAFRMVCSNGLYVGVGSVIAYKKIHVGEIPVQSIVSNALATFAKNDFGFWRKLKEIPVDQKQGLSIIGGWKPYEEKEEAENWKGNAQLNRWIRGAAERRIMAPESLDNQRNAWGLYNQMNQAIERTVARGQIDKKISGNVRMEEYLKSALSVN